MAPEFDLTGIDGEQIGRLMKLLADTDVEECEIEQGESSLSIKRAVRGRPALDPPAENPSPLEESPREEAIAVRATAVGTFYRSEDRSLPPRVEVGARVNTGDLLGWIEVMMIPHGMYSTHDGIVNSFLVEDGQPVEYGQPLVSLQPSAV